MTQQLNVPAAPDNVRLANVVKAISTRMAEAIEILGLTVGGAAKRIGWDKHTLRAVLAGKCPFDDIYPVLKACAALGMDVLIVLHPPTPTGGIIAVEDGE
jgi:hypothetical protein